MLRALFLKELRLQRSTLLLMGVLLLLALLLLALTPFGERIISGTHRLKLSAVLIALHWSILLPGALGAVPLLLGANLAAEERRLGMLDWQLAQPIARWRLWLLKLAVAAGLVLLFLTLMGLHTIALNAAPSISGEVIRSGMGWAVPVVAALALLLVACGAVCSTFATHPYQAFAGGAALAGLLCACFVFSPWRFYFGEMMSAASEYRTPARFLPLGMFALAFGSLALLGLRYFRPAPPPRRRALAALGLYVVAFCIGLNLSLLAPAPQTAGLVWGEQAQREFRDSVAGAHDFPLSKAHPLLASAALSPGRAEAEPAVGLTPYQLGSSDYALVSGIGSGMIRVNIRTGHIEPLRGVRWEPYPEGLDNGAIYFEQQGRYVGSLPVGIPTKGWMFPLLLMLTPSLTQNGEALSGAADSVPYFGSTYQGPLEQFPPLNDATEASSEKARIAFGVQRLQLRNQDPGSRIIPSGTSGTLLISASSRWYIRLHEWRKDPNLFILRSTEGKTSFTLNMDSKADEKTSISPYYTLQDSFDGRFVCLPLRGMLPTSAFQPTASTHDTPSVAADRVLLGWTAIRVVDTQTGKLHTLMPPRDTARGAFIRLSAPIQVNWSPASHRLVMMRESVLHVFDFNEASGQFEPVMAFDLSRYTLMSARFLDEHTLLAWGFAGLLRIDL